MISVWTGTELSLKLHDMRLLQRLKILAADDDPLVRVSSPKRADVAPITPRRTTTRIVFYAADERVMGIFLSADLRIKHPELLELFGIQGEEILYRG
jgi:hypothetical protein